MEVSLFFRVFLCHRSINFELITVERKTEESLILKKAHNVKHFSNHSLFSFIFRTVHS